MALYSTLLKVIPDRGPSDCHRPPNSSGLEFGLRLHYNFPMYVETLIPFHKFCWWVFVNLNFHLMNVSSKYHEHQLLLFGAFIIFAVCVTIFSLVTNENDQHSPLKKKIGFSSHFQFMLPPSEAGTTTGKEILDRYQCLLPDLLASVYTASPMRYSNLNQTQCCSLLPWTDVICVAPDRQLFCVADWGQDILIDSVAVLMVCWLGGFT